MDTDPFIRWKLERWAGGVIKDDTPVGSVRTLDPSRTEVDEWAWAGSTEGPNVRCHAITILKSERCPKRSAVRLTVTDGVEVLPLSLCGGHFDVIRRGHSTGITLIPDTAP